MPTNSRTLKNGMGSSSVEERNETAQELRALGFTDYEARIYLALLERSPATAYEVSKSSNLPRANVYNALEGLTVRLAVQPVSENPVRYIPAEPKVLFERIARDVTGKCRDVVQRLSSMKKQENTEHVWSLVGQDTVTDTMREMIKKAKAHIWMKVPASIVNEHREGLVRAAKRGVSVRIVAFGTPNELDGLTLGHGSIIYPHEGDGLVIGAGGTLVTITIDFKEALTANMANESRGAVTRSRPVVHLIENYIRHEFYLAEIMEKLGPSVEAEFGPALLHLRRRYLQSEMVDELERNLEALGRLRSTAKRSRRRG